MRMAAVGKMFFRSPQGNVLLATIDIVAPVSKTPRYSRPPRWIRTQIEHQVCRPPGASLSELRRAGHYKPLLLQFPRHAHETGALAGIRLVPIFGSTLGPLFLVGPVFGCPPDGSEFPPGVILGFPPDLSAFLSLSGLRSEPPCPPLPLPPWPLPLPLYLPWPLSLLALPLSLP